MRILLAIDGSEYSEAAVHESQNDRLRSTADSESHRAEQPVARAVWALAEIYHQKVEPSGPLFGSYSIEGDKVRLRFKHSTGLHTADGGPPKGFALAGADRKFYWANARIDGDTIVVWSQKVAKPVAVRYAWADNPTVDLYNAANLPASPFRTDDWKGVTAERK